MLIGKKSLNLYKYASKNPDKGSVRGVFVNGNEVAVTDGCFLIRIIDETPVKEEDYPEVLGKMARCPGVLPVETIKKVLKNMPKKTSNPVLNDYVQISIGQESHEIGITDLDNSQIIKGKNLEGEYPEYEKYFPEKFKSDVHLDAKLLKKLCEAVIDHSESYADEPAGVTLKFTGGDKEPVVFEAKTEDGSKMDGILMPLNRKP